MVKMKYDEKISERIERLSEEKLNELLKKLNMSLISVGETETSYKESVEKHDKIFRIISDTPKNKLLKVLEEIEK